MAVATLAACALLVGAHSDGVRVTSAEPVTELPG